MKRKLLNLSIPFLIVGASSCSLVKETKTIPIVHTKIIRPSILRCPKPEKPTYERLDESKPLLNKENLQKLLNNIAKMKNYCESLELTIKCYEHQLDTLKKKKEVRDGNKK